MELTSLLAEEDSRWKARSSAAFKKACDTLATEFDLMSTSQAKRTLQWARHKFYTCGNKPGPMLARKICSAGKLYHPRWLQTCLGCLTSNPAQIVLDFAEFLSSVCAKLGPFPVDIAESFFHDLNLPSYPLLLVRPLMPASLQQKCFGR